MQLPGLNYSKKDMFFFAHFWPMAERKGRQRKIQCYLYRERYPFTFSSLQYKKRLEKSTYDVKCHILFCANIWAVFTAISYALCIYTSRTLSFSPSFYKGSNLNLRSKPGSLHKVQEFNHIIRGHVFDFYLHIIFFRSSIQSAVYTFMSVGYLGLLFHL